MEEQYHRATGRCVANKPYDLHQIHGSYRADGSLIAYDYKLQAWIDTSKYCRRNLRSIPGSADNPLRYVPVHN